MKKELILAIFLWIIFPAFVFASQTEGMIDDIGKYAWGEKTGWVNFNPTNGHVRVTDEGITGYAWSANYGWINLAPTEAGVKNDGEGNLSGKAWSDKLGWVDFSGVAVDSNGNFSGSAGDGSSDFGQLVFSCDGCQVATDWRPVSLREDTDTGESDGDNDRGGSPQRKSVENDVAQNSSSFVAESVSEDADDDRSEESIGDEEENLKKVNDSFEGKKSSLMPWLWLSLVALVFFLIWLRKKRKKKSD